MGHNTLVSRRNRKSPFKTGNRASRPEDTWHRAADEIAVRFSSESITRTNSVSLGALEPSPKLNSHVQVSGGLEFFLSEQSTEEVSAIPGDLGFHNIKAILVFVALHDLLVPTLRSSPAVPLLR